MKLDRVEARERLKPRRDPYFQRLSEGRYVGFRKMTPDTPGTWIARFYDGEKYHHKRLGDFPEKLAKERFDAAKESAEVWFEGLDMGASTKPTAVKHLRYVEKLRTEPRQQPIMPRGSFAGWSTKTSSPRSSCPT
jgi:hypothetical protein